MLIFVTVLMVLALMLCCAWAVCLWILSCRYSKINAELEQQNAFWESEMAKRGDSSRDRKIAA